MMQQQEETLPVVLEVMWDDPIFLVLYQKMRQQERSPETCSQSKIK